MNRKTLVGLSTKILAVSVVTATFLTTVTAQDNPAPNGSVVSNAQKTMQLEWDKSTLTLIQQDAVYGRMMRLQDGAITTSYDLDGKVWVRHSRDEGKTWQKPIFVADWPHGTLTNIELLQLKSGSLLCFYNARPRKSEAPAQPFAIGMTRSEDGGQSWQKPTTLYSAGTDFSNGCWEPIAIQLPTGEIQLYFANESPYRTSAEQEITLMRSQDNGRTWGAPETVSFRAGSRDGMPVPIVLSNGAGIAMAIEDNGLSGNFKPVIVATTTQDNWRSGAVDGKSSRRWSALQTPLAPSIYAGAPYIRQMPTGETILSFQQSGNGDLNKARMVVCIGDERARNFAGASEPFPVTPDASQLWNSLFVKNRDTITAISQTTIKGVRGVWSIDGKLVRKLD